MMCVVAPLYSHHSSCMCGSLNISLTQSHLLLTQLVSFCLRPSPVAMHQLSPLRSIIFLSLLAVSISVSEWKYLTHDWTRGQANLYSDLAKEMYRSQRVCDKMLWYAPPNAGMGSDIHVSGTFGSKLHNIYYH